MTFMTSGYYPQRRFNTGGDYERGMALLRTSLYEKMCYDGHDLPFRGQTVSNDTVRFLGALRNVLLVLHDPLRVEHGHITQDLENMRRMLVYANQNKQAISWHP